MSELRLYVGTYTDRAPGASKGIWSALFDDATGKLSPPTPAAELANPSWLTLSRDGRFLYAASEVGAPDASGVPSGLVVAYAIDRSGKLAELNRVTSRGADPCPSGRLEVGARRGRGELHGGKHRLVPCRHRRSPRYGDERSAHGQGTERGAPGTCAFHSVDFSGDDRHLLSCDLGNDRVYVYKHDPATGTIGAHRPAYVGVEPGSGPRHIALHPSGRYAYVLAELASAVATFSWNASDGALVQRQRVSTLPLGRTTENTTAEIAAHPTGRFVYASNRGHDSIAVFSVDARNGLLTLLANTPTGGQTPRNFAVDPSGRWLLAANQRSDNIVTFAIDPTKGTLTRTGAAVSVPRPVCIAFQAPGPAPTR